MASFTEPCFPPLRRRCPGDVISVADGEDGLRVGAGGEPAACHAREPAPVHEEGGGEARGLSFPAALPQGRRGWRSNHPFVG